MEKSHMYLSSFIYGGNSQVALDVHSVLDEAVYPLIEGFWTLHLQQSQDICHASLTVYWYGSDRSSR